MLRLPESVRIFVASVPTDMRKQADGLSALVKGALGQEPRSGHLFVFFNRGRDMLRILFWDANGFCVVSKRLEAGRFRVPAVSEGQASVSLEPKQLAQLLSLVEAARARRRAVH
ncbi:IS66 family insertion sequence element accessory protein TnpB [Hyalangium sp.]|jgi:transposase|uniref:IS66 family insertion sequence element accessory protein TnpB n=1 Tax=Hyalangium sp. TaxID=2028555 RepID=UPI002D3AA4B9|nr:IS66 family insertion sequence element accessory protein TnpB [Hyalangium sp.]HYI01284.1 IS66 family insertion sequence element accessory protein TnpB [Hyalangium sp.]